MFIFVSKSLIDIFTQWTLQLEGTGIFYNSLWEEMLKQTAAMWEQFILYMCVTKFNPTLIKLFSTKVILALF